MLATERFAIICLVFLCCVALDGPVVVALQLSHKLGGARETNLLQLGAER